MKLPETQNYEDILYRPHPVSVRRCRMTNYDRAAQFSPFAALTGFDACIEETARLTDSPAELTEWAKAELNETLREILENIHTRPEITVTHFVRDQRKAGGAYVTATGRVKRIDEYSNSLLLTDGTVIFLENIFKLSYEAE